MDKIKISVSGNIAVVAEKPKRITSGTTGLPVEFTFDSEWDELRKVAVFDSCCVRKDMIIKDGATVVPIENLAKHGDWLCIGVYGVNEDGSVAIPTIWANAGMIYPGAVPEGDLGSDIGTAKEQYDAAVLASERSENAANRSEAAASEAENNAGLANDAAFRADAAMVSAVSASESAHQSAQNAGASEEYIEIQKYNINQSVAEAKNAQHYAEEAQKKAEDAADRVETLISAKYNSIEDALNDQNRATDGKVATHIVGDAINIILLEDIASATTVNITKDCTLHLNGKRFSFTAPDSYLNINTASAVTINGEVAGSEIIKTNIANAYNEKLISATETHLTIKGGTYSIADVSSTYIIPLRTESATTQIDMSDCTVVVDAAAKTMLYGTQFKGVSTIDNCSFTITNQTAPYFVAVLVGSPSNCLTLNNSNITATSNAENCQARAVNAQSAVATFENCNISIVSPIIGTDVAGISATSGCNANVINCHIEADGYGDDGETNGVTAINSDSLSSLTVNGGYYWGAREALSLGCTARINGGVYAGCQHGGAYMSSTDIKVKNATFRNVEYTGDCGWDDSHFGAVYCGGSSGNANVSFDNCRFESAVSTSHAITAKYTNTKVYLSNSVIDGNFGDDLRADESCVIYVGKDVFYDVNNVTGNIDTTTNASKEFGFETEPTNCENLVEIKTGLLQKQLDNAVKGKAYELIDEFVLEEEASSIARTKEPDGTPYNLSAVRVHLVAPANTSATNDISCSWYTKDKDNQYPAYLFDKAVSNREKRSVFMAYNDCGIVTAFTLSANTTSSGTVSSRPVSLNNIWSNAAEVGVVLSGANFPVGTQVTIYGIRG